MMIMMMMMIGGSRKIQKEGVETPTLTPHPPTPQMKTTLFRACSSKVTLTFQKHFENTRKKRGAAAPATPPLNLPMKVECRATGTKFM